LNLKDELRLFEILSKFDMGIIAYLPHLMKKYTRFHGPKCPFLNA
jgi:hypothetical protein